MGAGERLDDVLAELGNAFDIAYRLEQESYAASLLEEEERSQPFRSRLLRLRFGLQLRLHTTDGVISGRITGVGADWVRITEGEKSEGIGRGCVHEVRIDAISRIELGRGTVCQ